MAASAPLAPGRQVIRLHGLPGDPLPRPVRPYPEFCHRWWQLDSDEDQEQGLDYCHVHDNPDCADDYHVDCQLGENGVLLFGYDLVSLNRFSYCDWAKSVLGALRVKLT